MVGVPDVNQPRIEPGDTFVYELTPPDPGTYWYHSHTDGSQQLERGLYGSIVVDDAADSADYTHDQVWIIDDWLLDDAGQIDSDFNTTADRSHNGRWGNLITVNANTSEQPTVGPGDRVRLRLVNASNGRVYTPDFGGLDATVIAIDGLTVGRQPNGAMPDLAPGNRIDIDVTTPTVPGIYRVTDTFTGDSQPLASIASWPVGIRVRSTAGTEHEGGDRQDEARPGLPPTAVEGGVHPPTIDVSTKSVNTW